MKDYKDWSDITLKQFEDLKNITEVQDDWTMCNIIDYLFDVDSNNLTLTEFNEYVKKVDFLKKDLKPLKSVPEKMNINGIEYVTKANLAAITTAQYIDYQNYCKKKDVSYADVLSVFVMPEGHSYNDGYNIDTVKEDMLAMRVDFVVTLAFFFIRQFLLFVKIFRTSLRDYLKKTKLIDKNKKMLIEEIDKVDWRSLELSLMSVGSVKSSMRAGAQL